MLQSLSKRRHKKCDEAKPICRRCSDGGYVCDGYSHVAPVAGKGKLDSTYRPGELQLCRVKQHATPGTALEHFYLNHFFAYTIKDMMDIPNPVAMWNSRVVSLYQSSPFIQPAIVAVGAAHWLFITGTGRNAKAQALVINQYNQAISLLVSSIASGRISDIGPTLTCCLLFVLLESLRGNQAEALRHLEAGSRLIVDGQQGAKPRQIPQWLIAAFHSLCTQATVFADDRLFPDLTPHLGAAEKPGGTRALRPFADLDEANEALNRLDSTMNHICWDVPSFCENEVACNCPVDCACQGCQARKLLDDEIAAFSARFKPVAEKLGTKMDVTQRQRLLRLQLTEKMWQWLLVDGADYLAIGAERANELLDHVEQFLLLSASRPTFCLSADIIPSIIKIYEHCADPAARWRAIDLLRAHPRREIIFNSDQVADRLEASFSCISLDKYERNFTIGPSTEKEAWIRFKPRALSSSEAHSCHDGDGSPSSCSDEKGILTT